MFVWCFSLALVLLPAAAVGDLEALTLEISNLGRKVDSFQSFVLQDILSIKDKINKMDSKIDAMIVNEKTDKEKDQAQSGSQTHEASSLNDKIEPMTLKKQLDRIRRGFREEKEGIRHDLDDLKGISQNLLVGKDQIVEYLITLETSVSTFLTKMFGDLEDGILDITKNFQINLSTSIERNEVGIDKKFQSLKELVQQTDNICKSRSDKITETLTTALSASENTIVGYLNGTGLKTAALVDAVKKDLNTIKKNTGTIITNANINSPVRLSHGSKTLFQYVSGRLEILHDGVWGTVCDDGFDENDAKVACKMIDLNFTIYAVHPGGHYGRGSGMIWLDDLSCNGDEKSLFNCPGVVIGKHNCNHGEDVGIFCQY